MAATLDRNIAENSSSAVRKDSELVMRQAMKSHSLGHRNDFVLTNNSDERTLY